jgi:hypothetical protein
MTTVLIDVVEGDVHFLVSVRAESIRRSLELVKQRYSGCEARVVFPLDPELFFSADPAARTEYLMYETRTRIAR